MIATIPSAVVVGVEGTPVSVEVHVSNGLPGFTIVGLPDAAVRESRDRVRAALLSSGLPWPLRRVTVNLAPSGVRKGGSGLDLPIAVGLLVASGVVPPSSVGGLAFVGELGLDGSLRRVAGTVVLAECLGDHVLVVPRAGAGEALVATATVRCAPSLRVLVDCLVGDRRWDRPRADDSSEVRQPPASGVHRDLADVRGQFVARRALEVAAAGGHHLLMVGPPGSGKTMLATRLVGLLPDLSSATAMEVRRAHSAAGLPLPATGLAPRPPFRAPHHGASEVAMIGGGTTWMRPGEISLAHGGVLFLDEMGEFPRAVLDALRQPLEEGVVRVTRARGSATYPARFLLVGAMNPCPCGEGMVPGSCRCTPAVRQRYARRLSAPILDRFDIVVRLDRPPAEALLANVPGESSVAVAARVTTARARARSRGVERNAELAPELLDRVAPVSPEASHALEMELRSGALSARGLHRVRRIARTVADLEADLSGTEGVLVELRHVREALELRCRRDELLGPSAR